MKRKCTSGLLAALVGMVVLAGAVTGSDTHTGAQNPEVDNPNAPKHTTVRSAKMEQVGRIMPAEGAQLPPMAEGGIAGGGQCAGNCGGGFGDPGCYENEPQDCECYCDDACAGFGDCCPGVCDDCPDLLQCQAGGEGGIIYSNITTSQAAGFTHLVELGEIAADDLTMVGGGAVSEITFSLIQFANDPAFDDVLNDVDLDLMFWELEVDGAGTILPPVLGEEIAIVNVVLEDIALPGATGALFTIEDAEGFFEAPVNELAGPGTSVIWAGMRFNDADFDGAGGLTDIGQFLFNPPTIGASNDVMWGSTFGLFGFTDPEIIANAGWEIIAEGSGACCLGGGPACDGDIDLSGSVDVFDLLDLLAAWGPCADCVEDLDGSGAVDVFDLLDLLANWGPCPEGGVGGCEVLSPSECADMGGTYTVDGAACDWPGVCTDPVGACCSIDGSCDLLTGAECDAAGGVFNGEFVSCDAVTCAEAITCPDGAVQEDELCGGDSNGGCNTEPPAFSDLECDETVCGTGWAGDGTRDTDWYKVVLEEETLIQWCGEAEFPALFGIVDTGGVDQCVEEMAFLDTAVGGVNEEVCVTATLPAGTWYLFAAPANFDDRPCGLPAGNNYVASYNCLGLDCSCSGFCFDTPGGDCPDEPCWCDDSCHDNGDCCPDVCEHCDVAGCPDDEG